MMKSDAKKIPVVLTFYRAEILYDVSNISYVSGDVIKTDDEHDRHQVVDITEDGNADRVTRIMNLSFQECVHMLYAYTKTSIEDFDASDDRFNSPEKYELKLLVPETFSRETVLLLRDLIHEYIVYRILHDWFSITFIDRNEASMWAIKGEETKDKIMKSLNVALKRVRRTQTPF